MAECLHRKCGQRFGGVGGFDRHLLILDGAPWIDCRDPAAFGMVQTADGVWVRSAPTVAGDIA